VVASAGKADDLQQLVSLPTSLLPITLSAASKGMPDWLSNLLMALRREATTPDMAVQQLLKGVNQLFSWQVPSPFLAGHRRSLMANTSPTKSAPPAAAAAAAAITAALGSGTTNKNMSLPVPIQRLLNPLASVNMSAHDPLKMLGVVMQEFEQLLQKEVTLAGAAQLAKFQGVGIKLMNVSFNILNAANVDVLQGSNKDIDVLAGLLAIPRQLPLLIEALLMLMLPPGALNNLHSLNLNSLPLIKLPGLSEVVELVASMVQGQVQG
jgi:hypothetical protein